MKQEEQKFKQQFKLEYSAISDNTLAAKDTFTHDSRDIEEIVRLNSCLKSQLEELPQEYRGGFSDVSLHLSEIAQKLTEYQEQAYREESYISFQLDAAKREQVV